MAQPVLSIRNLSVDFRTLRGRVHALRDVSLDVPPNTIVGVLGESGCGKSTLINSVTGLLANNAEIVGGEAIFDHSDLVKLSERELLQVRGERISMVFQDPMTAQNPVISVGRQMTDTLYRRRDLSIRAKRELATGMLRKVGISDPEERMEQFPHEFSGGMRQRISIAMALMMSPDLFIADEPTTALDVTMEAQFIHLLRELQAEIRCAVLFISHNLGLIAELCDEVVVMYAGEVVEKGPIADIFFNPSHPYTRRLMECDPSRGAGPNHLASDHSRALAQPDDRANRLYFSRTLQPCDAGLCIRFTTSSSRVGQSLGRLLPPCQSRRAA